MPDQFRQVEDEYFKLRGQLSTGRITREQFESALHALMFSDAQGRYWMIGADSGEWFVHDGAQWIKATPQQNAVVTPPTQLSKQRAASQSAPATPAAAKSSGGCGRTLLIGCLILVLGCALIGGGVFFGVQSGTLTMATLLNLAGMGPAKININNFRDDALQVKIVQVNLKPDETPLQTTLELNAFDVRNFTASQPGQFRVTFAAGGGEVGACVVTLKSGDEYQFVTLPERIVVNRANNPPSRGSDLVVETSTLCRAQ